MAEQPDYSEASKVFEQSMKDAMAHLDKVKEEVLKAKEQAIDQEIAARDELHRIQREAEKISADQIALHQKEYDARVRNDTLMKVTEKLLRAGRSSKEIVTWLEISPEMMAHAQEYVGFELLGELAATVWYESGGRAGNVFFNWDGLIVKFPYEFAGGNTLAYIDIPTVEYWEKETGIPVERRDTVLQFMARRIVRDQAPGHRYEITADNIRISRDLEK